MKNQPRSLNDIEEAASLTELLSLNAMLESAQIGKSAKDFSKIAKKIQALSHIKNLTSLKENDNGEAENLIQEYIKAMDNLLGYTDGFKVEEGEPPRNTHSKNTT